jgi:hypothetical protein
VNCFDDFLSATDYVATVGTVGMFISHDDDGRINDKVAVKDTHIEMDEWDEAQHWTAGTTDKVPREYTFNKLVYDAFRDDHPSVVWPRKYAVYEWCCMHRIYMEFCQLVRLTPASFKITS